MVNVTPCGDWLLILFQLPTRPTAARVRTWRRLQRLGAVPVRNSGYALPHSDGAREDLEWLGADIRASGGDAMLFAARAVDPAADAALRAQGREARRRDYAALAKDAARLSRSLPASRTNRADRDRRALAERLAHLDAIDFFDAGRGHPARAAVHAVLDQPRETTMPTTDLETLRPTDFQRKTWVTRPRPGIDRFASAWLISRFIDPGARFGFAESVEAVRGGRQIPFDMYGAEFGHQAGGCTFETLVRRFAIRAPGIAWLARLVHSLDLKADTTDVPEAAAVGRLVDGLRDLHTDDAVLLSRGMELIDALHRSRPGSANDAVTSSPGKRRRPTRSRR